VGRAGSGALRARAARAFAGPACALGTRLPGMCRPFNLVKSPMDLGLPSSHPSRELKRSRLPLRNFDGILWRFKCHQADGRKDRFLSRVREALFGTHLLIKQAFEKSVDDPNDGFPANLIEAEQ
jgi:hypothetical protein